MANELADLFVGFTDAQSFMDMDVPVVVDPLLNQWHLDLSLESTVLVAHELSQALSWRVRFLGSELLEAVLSCFPARPGLRCERHRLLQARILPSQWPICRLQACAMGLLQVNDPV